VQSGSTTVTIRFLVYFQIWHPWIVTALLLVNCNVTSVYLSAMAKLIFMRYLFETLFTYFLFR